MTIASGTSFNVLGTCPSRRISACRARPRVGGSSRPERRGRSGGGRPHRPRPPAGDPEAAATRREARRAASVSPGPVTRLRIQPRNRAATRGRSQAADPERHRSRARLYPVASGSPLPAAVAESVSHLAPTADRMCARRSQSCRSTALRRGCFPTSRFQRSGPATPRVSCTSSHATAGRMSGGSRLPEGRRCP